MGKILQALRRKGDTQYKSGISFVIWGRIRYADKKIIGENHSVE